MQIKWIISFLKCAFMAFGLSISAFLMPSEIVASYKKAFILFTLRGIRVA